MERTLILNASYEPLLVVSWRKAVCLLYAEKVEVLAEYDRFISSVSFSLKLPSVLRLRRYIRVRHNIHQVKFTRSNIYSRDRHTCQYCGTRLPEEHLTFDHIIPVVMGGERSWENIVTCCLNCNHRKGGNTPQQVGMELIRPPRTPRGLGAITLVYSFHTAPDSWKSYLFWETCH